MSARVRNSERASDARLNFDVIYARASELGLSKGDLAELIGVNYSTLWRYSEGMIPRRAIWRRLERVLDLAEDELMQTCDAEPGVK